MIDTTVPVRGDEEPRPRLGVYGPAEKYLRDILAMPANLAPEIVALIAAGDLSDDTDSALRDVPRYDSLEAADLPPTETLLIAGPAPTAVFKAAAERGHVIFDSPFDLNPDLRREVYDVADQGCNRLIVLRRTAERLRNIHNVMARGRLGRPEAVTVSLSVGPTWTFDADNVFDLLGDALLLFDAIPVKTSQCTPKLGFVVDFSDDSRLTVIAASDAKKGRATATTRVFAQKGEAEFTVPAGAVPGLPHYRLHNAWWATSVGILRDEAASTAGLVTALARADADATIDVVALGAVRDGELLAVHNAVMDALDHPMQRIQIGAYL